MLDHVVNNLCRVYPLEIHSKVSCHEFLLGWEIAMEGKYDIEHATIRHEGEDTLIDDKNEP